jgi:hypothetical protein
MPVLMLGFGFRLAIVGGIVQLPPEVFDVLPLGLLVIVLIVALNLLLICRQCWPGNMTG